MKTTCKEKENALTGNCFPSEYRSKLVESMTELYQNLSDIEEANNKNIEKIRKEIKRLSDECNEEPNYKNNNEAVVNLINLIEKYNIIINNPRILADINLSGSRPPTIPPPPPKQKNTIEKTISILKDLYKKIKDEK